MTEETYFRIDGRRLNIGDTIDGQGARALNDKFPELELCLERRRPPTSLERTNCIFMSKSMEPEKAGVENASEKYIYELRPLASIEVRDLGWIGALQRRYPNVAAVKPVTSIDKQLLDLVENHFSRIYGGMTDEQIVDGYWSGQLSQAPELEYITASAEVVGIIRAPQS